MKWEGICTFRGICIFPIGTGTPCGPPWGKPGDWLPARQGGTLHLTELYDGATGECTRHKNVEVVSRSVIIVVGCYLLAQKITPQISILLYVNREVGRVRKIQREEEKQEGEFPNGERVGTVVTTWEQIEEPTFFRHLIEHGSAADIVVDTSDLKSMGYQIRPARTGGRRGAAGVGVGRPGRRGGACRTR